jgi:transketolase
MAAPKFGVSNLCAIIDANNGQIDGPVSQVMPIEPLADKWRAFGWHVLEIDGHDCEQILSAYADARKQQEQGSKKPTLIIARTVKGKGVSFMEHQIGWHGVAPKAEEGTRAIDEIRKNGGQAK